MHEHIQAQLPFYVNGTLKPSECKDVEIHLAHCSLCSHELSLWMQTGDAIRDSVSVRHHTLPPLSPLIGMSRPARPTVRQALRSSLHLIWSQRFFLQSSGMISAVGAAILLGTLATFSIQATSILPGLPIILLIPFIAILAVAFLHDRDHDPAYEIVASLPTPTASLLVARLSVILGLILLLSTLASAVTGTFLHSSVIWLIASWLGPMFLLSAITTLLSLMWNPFVAGGFSSTIWAGIIYLLIKELQGTGLTNFSILAFLQPEPIQMATQILLAILLWTTCWFILARELTNQATQFNL